MVLVPADRLLHATPQVVLRLEAQFPARGLDVALPVALPEDVELVLVERYQLARAPAIPLARATDQAQHPDGSRDADPPRRPGPRG